MTTLPPSQSGIKHSFDVITHSFLQKTGLPFSSVLDAESIRQIFSEEEAFFGQDDIFSTEIVLWAFLAQTLRDGKGSACAAAVADIATHLLQTGQQPPSGDTGDYCRARAKLNVAALQRLVRQSGRQLEQAADPSWLWKGRHAKLVDGFTFTMPDTPANQAAFPQQKSQRPGIGFPIARACAVLSLATASLCDIAIGPYKGKETGELALLRRMLTTFDQQDVAVFDRYYGSYMMVAMLIGQGTNVCARLHPRRASDFRRGRRLGPDDHLMTWSRPNKPDWMSDEQYETIPEKLELRELRFQIKEDILQIKQTLNLDHLRCKSPEMVSRELWVTLLAYNLIRKLIATAAAVHDKQPRCLGFTLACQTVLASWMLFSTGSCSDAAAMQAHLLASIAANKVANRPGRIEPRVLKRRRHRYPLMQCSRQKWRTECKKT
jgi:hypothetical protein